MRVNSRLPYRCVVFGVILILGLVVASFAELRKPNYAVGEKAPPFKAVNIGGKPVNFPEDYKGKLVLLDFWATWCPPCREEIPGLVEVYQKQHTNGLEILSISLDQPKQGQKVLQFIQQYQMFWNHIYDGKYFKNEQAELYKVPGIPAPILVDGDTGIVIAAGTQLRGKRLAPTVEEALAQRQKK